MGVNILTRDVPIGDVPIGDVPIGDVPIGDVPIGDVPIGDVPNPQYSQICKKVGRELARQLEGWPQYFLRRFSFSNKLVTIVSQLVRTPLQQVSWQITGVDHTLSILENWPFGHKDTPFLDRQRYLLFQSYLPMY